MSEWWQRTCTALLWIALGVGGCAPATTPATWQPGNAQPLIVGWQQYFDIAWGVTRHDGGALIDGYITNTWGFAVRDVRVLVNGYDSSGTQTGQVIAWGPGAIQPGNRVYFDVRVPAVAATYDVSIYSWKWTWPPSGGTVPPPWTARWFDPVPPRRHEAGVVLLLADARSRGNFDRPPTGQWEAGARPDFWFASATERR